MIGTHLIKSWAKTQATIAKSSAESELYGIVRGTCEALGFISLAEDLGSEMTARLHMDATAAQGIVDRQGLSKVRHLDVNLLWLQEQLARDKVPLIKVPGPENNADLMTKHLMAEMIRRHTTRMSLEFRDGRSQKAANHQSVASRVQTSQVDCRLSELHPREQRQREARDQIIAVCDRFSERHGGDAWKSRGANGEWTRLHATPRRSLFTPCRVARGPAHPDCLRTRRVTEGVDIQGNRFRIDDNWREPGIAHKVLDLPWTGVTTFRSRDVIWAEEEPEGRESGVPTPGTQQMGDL